jgi:hypothetical protein
MIYPTSASAHEAPMVAYEEMKIARQYNTSAAIRYLTKRSNLIATLYVPLQTITTWQGIGGNISNVFHTPFKKKVFYPS